MDKSLISKYILKHYVRQFSPITVEYLTNTTRQWNGFVELLPLWLAPNMVTLLGFFFILANVICLEIFIPDLVGPVGNTLYP